DPQRDQRPALHGAVRLAAAASRASAAVASAAPNRIRSFMRNPPNGLSGDITPGVVIRNDSVVANVAAAIMLPIADHAGSQRRAASNAAAISSTTPSRSDPPCTPSSGYSQLNSGLCSTSGRIAFASVAPNLAAPHITSSAISPQR